MRPGVLQDPAPQGRVGQHSGIGYELVLALDVPVLQMVEQPVDASALAFFEEEEAKALNAEYLTLARSATSHTVRLREVIQRMHVLRQKGRGRKKKKRRKKRLPRSPRPRQVPGCCLRSTRSILAVKCPHGFLQDQDVLHLGRYGPEGLYAASPWPNDSAMVRQCRIPCWFRSFCSSAVVFLPSVPQRQIPMVQTVQQTTKIPQMPFVFRWSMPLLCRFCASQVVSLRTQRTAWFDSGYMRCVSLRSIHFLRLLWIMVLRSILDLFFSAFAWFNSEYKFMRQSTWLVFLVTMHLALYSFVVLRPKMPVFMAGMDHRTVGGSQVQFLDKVLYLPVVVLCVVLRSRQCCTLFGGSAVAAHHGRRLSLFMRSGSPPWSCLLRKP